MNDRLRELLEESDATFEVIEHPPAYTAQEEAAATHTPGRAWAKTVVVRADREAVIAVLPATHQLSLERMRQTVGADDVELADEDEFPALYPDCEPGAMPPFGVLYGQTTFVDETLREVEEIVFHAGDHETAVAMPYAEFERVASPVPGEFSTRIED